MQTMKEQEIIQMKADAVEEYRKRIVKKVDGVCGILRITRPVDDSEQLTQEELLAIKNGAVSAYTFILGLLGEDGEQTEQGAWNTPDSLFAEGTVGVGAALHYDELIRRGL